MNCSYTRVFVSQVFHLFACTFCSLPPTYVLVSGDDADDASLGDDLGQVAQAVRLGAVQGAAGGLERDL